MAQSISGTAAYPHSYSLLFRNTDKHSPSMNGLNQPWTIRYNVPYILSISRIGKFQVLSSISIIGAVLATRQSR